MKQAALPIRPYRVRPYRVRPTYAAIGGALLAASASPALAVSDEEFRAMQAQLDALTEQVESQSQNDSRTHLGGYGEMHYNNLSNGAGGSKKELDFHRFVLFVDHEFNDRIRFYSELEVEHANTEAHGVVELEQAFVQFDLNERMHIDAGMFLIPVGILNETHEPPTFYGVERNPVEKYIIPVTWREGGVMLGGNTDAGFSYNIALSSGLNKGVNIRDGRQSVSRAAANNLAATARLKYTGIAGLELAATLQYQDDMTQDSSDDIGSATLVETHARYTIASFTLTGLYARWDIDGSGASSINKDKQDGGYLEAAYRISPRYGVFARHNQWDNGGAGDTKKTQTNVGVNVWPHENVVLKADYQLQNAAAGDFDGINLGIGYQF